MTNVQFLGQAPAIAMEMRNETITLKLQLE